MENDMPKNLLGARVGSSYASFGSLFRACIFPADEVVA